MNVTEAILQRRTVVAFRPEPVSPDLIANLLETAVHAPNHRLTQPWRFVMLDVAMREQYIDLRCDLGVQQGKNRQAIYANLAQVPAFLFVVMAQHPDPITRDEDRAATAALVQNMMLLALEQQLGSKWVSFPNEPRCRSWLQLADNETVVAVLHIGYPAGQPPTKPRIPARQRLATLTAAGLQAWATTPNS